MGIYNTINKDYLVVGNSIYTKKYGVAIITKVGRKYTYTDNKNFVIDNYRLTTKCNGGIHNVFKSEQHYNETERVQIFTESVEMRLRDIDLSQEDARKINDILNLGIKE